MNTKALLVVDVQEEYIERYEDGLLKRINQRIEKAAENNELIIYIKNIKTLRNKEKTSPLAEELYIASTYVFNKKKSSAFSNNELVKFIKENEVANIEIIGVDGNFCVSSTAKEGKKIFQNITVNCDGIGTLNGQRFEKTKETLNELGVEIR